MKYKLHNKQSGFTLVELSIVLVIIGLLIGGILVGQSLVNSAKINKQVQQIQQIQVSVEQFRNKFKCLPGDCGKIGATGSFSTGQPTTVCAGNGDGLIGGGPLSASTGNEGWSGNTANCLNQAAEHLRVFEHLHITGMYPWKYYDDSVTSVMGAPGTGYPKMVIDTYPPRSLGFPGGVILGYEAGVGYIKSGHKIRLGYCPGNSGGAVATSVGNMSFYCGPALVDMQALDAKMDDAKPYSGDSVVTSDYYIYRVPNGFQYDATSCCAISASNTYRDVPNTANTSQGSYVGLEINMGF